MKSSTVRELHLKTSEIVRQVVAGESFIIEKRGVPVAGIRPISDPAQATHAQPGGSDYEWAGDNG